MFTFTRHLPRPKPSPSGLPVMTNGYLVETIQRQLNSDTGVLGLNATSCFRLIPISPVRSFLDYRTALSRFKACGLITRFSFIESRGCFLCECPCRPATASE